VLGSIGSVDATLVPGPEQRPSVFPSERFGPTGILRPELRAPLRRIHDARNALSVLGLWAVVVGVAVGCAWSHRWWVVVLAFIAMGPVHVRFAILMHEAAHRLLFSRHRLNDAVGTWLLAYPALVPFRLYRRGHLAHHREVFGPDDPDVAFYGDYPSPRRVLLRRLARDAAGISGAKLLAQLGRGLRSSTGRTVAASILLVQAALWAGSWAALGDWWLYPVLWLLPWGTQWRVLNRLRAIAEHGGMRRDEDARASTHDVAQRWLARCWIVPYRTGWHLAHHVDMGIPWRNLARLHDELVAAGYVAPTPTWPSYTALWRATVASGD
jgi:fatty acid desaturase